MLVTFIDSWVLFFQRQAMQNTREIDFAKERYDELTQEEKERREAIIKKKFRTKSADLD